MTSSGVDADLMEHDADPMVTQVRQRIYGHQNFSCLTLKPLQTFTTQQILASRQ